MINDTYEIVGFTCMECNKKFRSMGERKECKGCGMDLCGTCARKHGGLCVWCLDAVSDEKRWALALVRLMMGLSFVFGFLIPAPIPLILLLESNPVTWGFAFMYGFIFLIVFTIIYSVVKARAIKEVHAHAPRDVSAVHHAPVTPLVEREPTPTITPPPSEVVQALPGSANTLAARLGTLQIPEDSPIVEKPASAAPETGIEFVPANGTLANEETIAEVQDKAPIIMDVDELPGENEPADGIRLRKIETGELQAGSNHDHQDSVATPINDDSTREPQPETMKLENEQSKQQSIAWLEKQLMQNVNENDQAPEPPTIEKKLDFTGDIDHDLDGLASTRIPESPDMNQLRFAAPERSVSSTGIEPKEQSRNFFCQNCGNHFQGTQNRINICPFCGFPVKS